MKFSLFLAALFFGTGCLSQSSNTARSGFPEKNSGGTGQSINGSSGPESNPGETPRLIARLDGSKTSQGEIDRLINRLMSEAKVDGLALSVLNNNQVVYKQAYGWADKAKGIKPDTSTVMYGASFSKAVFAWLNLRLAGKGLIDLDRPLFNYLKSSLSDYGPYEEVERDPRWKLITPRMCLSHTTGLPNIWFMEPKTGAVDTTLTNRIYFTPGTRYAYSGEGLKLLQRIEEKWLGKNLEVLAQEEVFQPLGMYRTSYIWQEVFESNAASGHDEKGVTTFPQRAGKPGGAGSMCTTISDYSRFISGVLKMREEKDSAVLQMLTPQIAINSVYQFPTMLDSTTDRDSAIHLSYGLGWGLLQSPYGPAFFKEGHHDYWRNYQISFPDAGISIIIMSNSANAESIFREILEKVIGDIFTPWEWERYLPYNYAR